MGPPSINRSFHNVAHVLTKEKEHSQRMIPTRATRFTGAKSTKACSIR